MIKILPLIGLLACSSVNAWDTRSAENFVEARTNSDKYPNTAVSVTFSYAQDCAAAIHHETVLAESYKSHEWETEMKLRVDKQTVWTSKGKSQIFGEFQLMSVVVDKGEFLVELMKGSTLRVRFPLEDGSHQVDAFSLGGSQKAIKSAYNQCVNNKDSLEYFDSAPSVSDEDFF